MKARGFLLLALGATLLIAAGCGGSGDDEVTVQTGSLSKAKFIEKADAICEAAQNEFKAKYFKYLREHKDEISGGKKKAPDLYSTYLETILTPYIEKQVTQISSLGAPDNYAPEVASYLNAFQEKLREVQDDPAQLEASVYPFERAEAIAKKAGLNGCAPIT